MAAAASQVWASAPQVALASWAVCAYPSKGQNYPDELCQDQESHPAFPYTPAAWRHPKGCGPWLEFHSSKYGL